VTRASGPEEFFEVFREVQKGRKKPEHTREGHTPAPSEPADTGGEEASAGEVRLSYPAAGGAVLIAVLLVVLGYLVGRQDGWRAYEAFVIKQATTQAAKPDGAKAAAQKRSVKGPEIVNGLVFTLLTLGKGQADKASAEKEAEYLNSYAPFRALQVRAYVWRDGAGRYRVCAAGLKDMDEATRKQVRDGIRNLVSRHGRREYRDCDFLPQ